MLTQNCYYFKLYMCYAGWSSCDYLRRYHQLLCFRWCLCNILRPSTSSTGTWPVSRISSDAGSISSPSSRQHSAKCSESTLSTPKSVRAGSPEKWKSTWYVDSYLGILTRGTDCALSVFFVRHFIFIYNCPRVREKIQ